MVSTVRFLGFLRGDVKFLHDHFTEGCVYEVTSGPRQNGEVCVRTERDAELWLLPDEWEKVAT